MKLGRINHKVVLALTTLLLLLSGSAEGHAELQSARPGPGETVSGQLGEIVLTFQEPLGPGSAIQLFGEGFRKVEEVEVALAPDSPEILLAKLPELTPDTYTVQWIATGLDGHKASGSYQFRFLAGRGLLEGGDLLVLVVLLLGLSVALVAQRKWRRVPAAINQKAGEKL